MRILRLFLPILFIPYLLFGQRSSPVPLRQEMRPHAGADVVAQGTVAAVEPGAATLPRGTLRLNTPSGPVTVHIGPTGANLRRGERALNFAPGDQVSVTGVLVRRGNASLLLAREIRRGDEVIRIRNERGLLLRSSKIPAAHRLRQGGSR